MTTTTADPANLADQLAALWAPPPTKAAALDDDEYEDEYDDEFDAHCGPGCGCTMCLHHDHTSLRTCSVHGCEGLTTYKLVAWRPDGGTVRHESEPGGDRTRFSEAPMNILGSERTACGDEHALQLADELRDRYNQPDTTPDTIVRVRIERYRYVPDAVDLPPALTEIRYLGEQLHGMTQRLVDYANKWHPRPPYSADIDLAATRRYVAQLAQELARLDTAELPSKVYTGTIPADVRSVRTQPANTESCRYLFRRLNGSGWATMSGDEIHDSDAALLGTYGQVYQNHRSVLVLPEDEQQS